MDSQESSSINRVDLPDSSEASIVAAINEEEKAQMNQQEREQSLAIIAKLQQGIATYEGVSTKVVLNIQTSLCHVGMRKGKGLDRRTTREK